MSKFIVRVEMHNATGQDYSSLHEAMRLAGYYGLIAGSDGHFYELPGGEYQTTSTASVTAVMEAAYNIAARIRPNPSVIASEYSAAAWKGLRKI